MSGTTLLDISTIGPADESRVLLQVLLQAVCWRVSCKLPWRADRIRTGLELAGRHIVTATWECVAGLWLSC